MARPGRLGEHPHQDRGDAVGAVIPQARRQEAEDERVRRAPEPNVLVQRVQRGERERESQEGPSSESSIFGGVFNFPLPLQCILS